MIQYMYCSCSLSGKSFLQKDGFTITTGDSRQDQETFQTAAPTTVDMREHMLSHLLDLCTRIRLIFSERYNRSGTLRDIHISASISRLSLECTPDGSEKLTSRLSNYAMDVGRRFGRLGQLVDIEAAIAAMERAVDLTADNHPLKPYLLSNLATSLQIRFERLGEGSDIAAAIVAMRCAINFMPDDQPHKVTHLINLGNCLQTAFSLIGDLSDLEEAIMVDRRAVELIPDSHPLKPAALTALGQALVRHFVRLGDYTVIEDALLVTRRAVRLTPAHHPDYAARLNAVGTALATRFERSDEHLDIANAISAFREAINLTPDTHPSKPEFLNNLGNALVGHFKWVHELADLDEGVSATRRAVELTPDKHPNKAGHLNNLGNCLKVRFGQRGEFVDIDDSIAALRHAVKLTFDGHYLKPGRLSNLGSCLAIRFQKLGELIDIEDAIAASLRAVSLTPNGDYFKSVRLYNLGSNLNTLLRSSLRREHYDQAHGYYLAAFESPSVSSSTKLRAAVAAARMCSEFRDLAASEELVLQAHKRVFEAIPSFIGLGQSNSHRIFQLARWDIGSAIGAAASAALYANQPSLALEWLEQGRSIVWAQLDRLQSPCDGLRGRHPDLAEELDRVSASLRKAGGLRDRTGAIIAGPEHEPAFPTAPENAALYHRNLARHYEALITRIRALDGFVDFLRPKTVAQLAPACRDGPVAVITVHTTRCDALVLCPQARVVHVPLPEFSLELAEKLHASVVKGTGGRYARSRNDRAILIQMSQSTQIRHVLKILWLRVVQPVLSSIENEAS
jgi:tetratricopeptide (TPR) repeat protein